MILNTNLLNKEDNEIQLGDKIYKIPGDVPVKLYLKLLGVNQKGVEGISEGLDVVYDIFKIYHPDFPRDEYDNGISISKYTAIINFIFAGMSIEETISRLQEAEEGAKDGKKKPPQAVS